MPEGDDWRPIVALCAGMARDLADLVPRAVDRIRAEIAEYAIVPREEHEWYVREQYEGLLVGLAERRPPTAGHTARARDLGAQRARQGVPVDAVVGAFHVGFREMWNALVDRAGDRPELTRHLIGLVDLVWTWARLASSAAADGYAETVRGRQALQVDLRHRFLQRLHGGETAAEDTIALAFALSYDPDGEFQAVCAPVSAWPDERLDRLQSRLNAPHATVHTASRGALTVVLFQGVAADAVVATMRADNAAAPLGVGLVRRALPGAEATIVDAGRALAVAVQQGGTVSFGESWLLATLLVHRERLAPVLRRDPDIAASHPHLAAAVRAYAEHGFSVTAGAAALRIHPNTAKYRLDRWHELTGWDPRTLPGLLASLTSLGLFPVVEGAGA